jgi:ribosome-binding factor A
LSEVSVSGRRHDHRSTTPYARTARVNQVLREVIADHIERISDSDDRLRMATVTSVDVSADLRTATVYMSSLTEEAAEALASERADLQRAVAREVRLKRTPTLDFAADPAVVAGTRIDEIIRHIHERDDASHFPESDDAPHFPESDDAPGDEPE